MTLTKQEQSLRFIASNVQNKEPVVIKRGKMGSTVISIKLTDGFKTTYYYYCNQCFFVKCE
jgi:hypothetical protein